MSLALWMYVISVVSEIEMISSIIIWTVVLVAVITVPIYAVASEGFSEGIDEKIQKYVKATLLFILIPAIILVTLLPNKNEMYIMVGLHFGEKALTSEKGNELLDKSYEALLANIEESTKEVIKDNSK